MLNITRKNQFYRPYSTNVNGVERYVDEIYIYNKEGIILKINQGWFEDKKGKDITNLELNTDKKIILRRKEKFDGEIYIMNTDSPYKGEKRCILYIPNDLIQFKKVKRYLSFNYTVVDVWESDILNVKHEVWRNEFKLNNKLYELEKQFKELKEDYDFKLSNDIDVYIEKIKELKEEYNNHIEWIKSLNINEL